MVPIIVAVLAAIVAALFFVRWRSAATELQSTSEKQRAVERRVAALDAQRRELEAAVARLARFEGVADADEEAARLIAAARTEASELRAIADALRQSAAESAATIREDARTQAAETVSVAKARAEKLEAEARIALEDGRRRATEVIAVATRRAEEIAGDAMKALAERRENEAAITAMTNVMDGYGNRFVVPTHSLLDELAESFGHSEAGLRLKETRERARGMILRGEAAACDYVERERRETAIRFVIDAFNGKTDSVLALVKHDNVGTLQQQIKDAFALVNHNGVAFRNARILPEYLNTRLEELRWAATVQELRVQEREEQRRIKEQIREEEKARREFERAIREAAKEEEMLRRAMEKAEQQLAKASDAQRAKFEEQLAALSARLIEAEAKNQRALSMAQQTRRGHVYIISNVGSFGEQVYKIGLTRRLEPLDRIRELGDSSVPFEFDVHALIFAEDAPALEHRLHRHFALGQINKVNYRKEFFRLDLADLRTQIEAIGLTAQWTMTAAAREYHESLAIEAVIRDDPEAREAWLRRQLQLERDDPFASDEEPLEAPVPATSTVSLPPPTAPALTVG